MSKLKQITINVFDELGSDAAISVEDGKALFDKIDEALSNHLIVSLDFLNINIIITAFLNAAIGQLYSKYNSDELNEQLKVINLQPDNFRHFKWVIDRAKEYFKNPEQKKHYDSSYKEIIGDE